MKIVALILCGALAGCAGGWEQADDAFGLSLPDYYMKWHPKLNWEMEDIHVYTNLEVDELATDTETRNITKYRNGTCLLAAERKYALALKFGYNERHLEIVVIKLSEDAAVKADWSNGWPTHAVLRYGNTIYDNGFISDIPFELEELLTPRYGTQVPDVWSKYRK